MKNFTKIKPFSIEKLINETEIFDESNSSFWSENYAKLAPETQKQFIANIKQANQEIREENEEHASKLAEIMTKFEAKINALAQKNQAINSARTKLKAGFRNPAQDVGLLTALREAGEIS